jgi:hypothetical protein
MKAAIFVLSIIVSLTTHAQSHFSTVIGTNSGTVSTITYDLNVLKQEWQSVLYDGASISVIFSNVSIVNEGSYYALVASDSSNSINAAIEIVLDGGNFYELSAAGNGRTVTCTGCTYGCNPKKDAKYGWYCDNPCTKCVKTETVTTGRSIIGSGG